MCVLFYNTIARGLSTSTFSAAENGPSNHLLARVCVCVCVLATLMQAHRLSSITRDVSKQSSTGAVWLSFRLASDARNADIIRSLSFTNGSAQSKDPEQRGHDLQRLPLNAFHGSAKGSRERGFFLGGRVI